MNFANLMSATYNIEVSLLFSFISNVASFEEAEQLSITFK